MVWKRFSHEVGFGTRACLERVCVREKHPLTDSIPINRGGISKDSPKRARCPPGEVQKHSAGYLLAV